MWPVTKDVYRYLLRNDSLSQNVHLAVNVFNLSWMKKLLPFGTYFCSVSNGNRYKGVNCNTGIHHCKCRSCLSFKYKALHKRKASDLCSAKDYLFLRYLDAQRMIEINAAASNALKKMVVATFKKYIISMIFRYIHRRQTAIHIRNLRDLSTQYLQ